jgi:hypothetical protein
MWLNDEIHIALLQPLAQFVKFIHGEDHTKMRDRHVVLVYMVAVLLGFETFPYETNSQQVVVEIIANGVVSSTDFLRFDDI